MADVLPDSGCIAESQCSDTHLASCSLDVFGRGGAPYSQQEVQAHQQGCQQPQDNAERAIQPCNMLGPISMGLSAGHGALQGGVALPNCCAWTDRRA